MRQYANALHPPPQANRFDLLFCVKLKGMFDPRKGLAWLPIAMEAFAKFILNPLVRPFVFLLFGITTTVSIAFAFRIDIGLDQTLALPKVRKACGRHREVLPSNYCLLEGFTLHVED